MPHTQPLDNILNQRSKITILRLLTEQEELTGRGIAKKIRLTPRAAHLALKTLLSQGIITRKTAGTAHIFSLDRRRFMVQDVLLPLFKNEKRVFNVMVDELKKLLNFKNVVTVAFFGSIARGESDYKSDADVLVILKNVAKKEKLADVIHEHSHEFISKFGMAVSPYIIDVNEFAKRFDKKDKLIRNMVREAWVVWGKSLSEILINEP